MSNQIADSTIKSCYVIKEQNGHLDFIPKFVIFVQKWKLYASALRPFKDWAQQKKKTVCEFVWGKDVANRKFVSPFTSN